MFRCSKYRLVTLTSSVAMVAPRKSSGQVARESSGTANTHLTLLRLCLA
jgi:hypothetical protein